MSAKIFNELKVYTSNKGSFIGKLWRKLGTWGETNLKSFGYRFILLFCKVLVAIIFISTFNAQT